MEHSDGGLVVGGDDPVDRGVLAQQRGRGFDRVLGRPPGQGTYPRGGHGDAETVDGSTKTLLAQSGAGVGDPAAGPLQWAEGLHRSAAPGAEAAGRVVRRYLDARFGRRPADDADRAEIARALAEARAALRSHRKVAAR